MRIATDSLSKSHSGNSKPKFKAKFEILSYITPL